MTLELKVKLQKKYVRFISENPLDLDVPENLQYFNQVIEADAYGREIAQRLLTEYNIFKGLISEREGFLSKTDLVFDALKQGIFLKKIRI